MNLIFLVPVERILKELIVMSEKKDSTDLLATLALEIQLISSSVELKAYVMMV
jgi:hypothetical protein